MYICDCCKFRTVKDNNFKRRLSTTKHIRELQDLSTETKKKLEQNTIQITVVAHLSSDDREDGWDGVYEEIGEGKEEGDRDEDQREDEPLVWIKRKM